ncbi:MAG: LytTR family DNA-binding domain-containing protein [Oscillospiraceae bacterium]
MKIAICDDEQIYVDEIHTVLDALLKSKGIAAQFSLSTNAAHFLNQDFSTYDIVFLDVNMGMYNGIEVAKQIRQSNEQVLIVYISALLEYAIMGYSVRAFDYLLKADLNQTLPNCLDKLLKEIRARQQTFSVKTDAEEMVLTISEVVYLESKNHHVTIYLKNNRIIQLYRKLTDLEQQLSVSGFLRVHKSFLVNMNYIKEMKQRVCILRNGLAINCSKDNYSEIIRTYLLWKGEHQWNI